MLKQAGPGCYNMMGKGSGYPNRMLVQVMVPSSILKKEGRLNVVRSSIRQYCLYKSNNYSDFKDCCKTHTFQELPSGSSNIELSSIAMPGTANKTIFR